MKETTTHCDYCGNPLGVKCDRTSHSAIRAKLHGVWVCCRFVSHNLWYGFFCNAECSAKFIAQGELHGEEKIHKTQDEKKEGSN